MTAPMAEPKPPRDMSKQTAARKAAALGRRLQAALQMLGEHGYTVILPGAICASCGHPLAAHGLTLGACYTEDCQCRIVAP